MIIYNYYFAILVLSIIFYLIANKNPSILLAIIIIIILGYYYLFKINNYNDNLINNYKNKIKLIETEFKNRKEVSTNDYIFKKFPVEIKYLDQDSYLIDLLLNIKFIKIFDQAKWSDIILLFEKLMKVYIYMLGDRYDIRIYFKTFLHIRTTIIKELYSIFIIIPQKLKYTYNLNPFEFKRGFVFTHSIQIPLASYRQGSVGKNFPVYADIIAPYCRHIPRKRPNPW